MAKAAQAQAEESGKDNGKRQPDYNIRVKVQDADNRGGAIWTTIGVMFKAQLPDGKIGWSIRFNSFPPAFLAKGEALAMPPLPREAE